MTQNIKFKTCFIVFILLISSLSIFIIPQSSVKADEGDAFFDLFLHPFKVAAIYENTGNESIKISGDVVFDLYFTAPLSARLRNKDEVKVSLLTLSTLLEPKELENGEGTLTLKPELIGDSVQKYSIKLEGVNHTIKEGDFLIFSVEVIQSGKAIGNLIEKRYGDKLMSRLEKIANWLNQSSNEELNNLGAIMMEMLQMSEVSGITPEEIASLANSFSSSAFVYNSSAYASSVTLDTNSDENKTLYFEYAGYESEFPVSMVDVKPNGSATTWPTQLIDIDTGDLNSEEWLMWLSTWLLYITGEEPNNEEPEKNIITYYLNNENKLVTTEPDGDTESRFKFTGDPIKFEGISFDRNRIIENATADLYLHLPQLLALRKVSVLVTLFDETDETTIANKTLQLGRSNIIEFLLRGPSTPLEFEFDDLQGKEIWNNHDISLIISASGGRKLSLRKPSLLYGSTDYPSSITFNLKETENIKINLKSDENQKIIPGGSALYIIEVQSKYDDTIDFDYDSLDDLTNWDVDLPNSVGISAGSSKLVYINVTYTKESLDAYGKKIDLTFIATGKTGRVSKEASVKIDEDAVEFNIDVIKSKGKDIKHGEKGIYHFKIKNNNTGLWPDDYTIEAYSQHNWTVELIYDEADTLDVDYGEEFFVNVSVLIPKYTEITSDILTLTVISEEGDKTFEINVTTTVITPNILENIYGFFESVAKDIGLDEALGDYAAAFLIFLLIFLILIFLIPAIYLIRRKYVEIVCMERVKEISPDEEAKFNILIENPLSKSQTYEIQVEKISESQGWEASIDKERIVVDPYKSNNLILTVKPTDYAKSEDWIEVKVKAKIVGRDKSDELSTITTLKNGKPDIRIIGVVHWPKVFSKGDRVESSFRLENRGNVSASNINVILYINGKEKNKVEDITIPCGGYAEVEIPWIAVKGKNEINIVVK